MTQIPSTQYAIQIVGKEEFVVNPAKPVDPVGPTQIMLEVEACGICFSDTKLLHQFDGHPRKSDVVAGIDLDALKDIPSYHPNQEAVTPGHEPVVRVVQVGEKVTHFKVGDRLLVQADWKHLRTAKSNGAFGYNFDGALEEYVVVDERCVVSPDGEEFLIHVSEGRRRAVGSSSPGRPSRAPTRGLSGSRRRRWPPAGRRRGRHRRPDRRAQARRGRARCRRRHRGRPG